MSTMSLAAVSSLLSPTARRTEEQTEEQKIEPESLSCAENEPKDPQLSVLKEPLENAEEKIALNQKVTEESQKECNNLANQGDLAKSVLKEPLKNAEENIALNQKITEESQKECHDLANQGDSANPVRGDKGGG